MDPKLLIEEFDRLNGYPIAKWIALRGIGVNNSLEGLKRQNRILKKMKDAGIKISY